MIKMGDHRSWLYFSTVLILLQLYKSVSENLTVAYFYTECDEDHHIHVDHLLNETLLTGSSTYNLSNNFEILTLHVCDINTINEREIFETFQNTSIDVYVGPLDYPVDQMLIKYALLFHRPYMSPFSPLLHFENQRVFSVGSGFEQTAVAVVTVMNHFQWRDILIIASMDEMWMELGNVIFIYLSSDGFEPAIRYLRTAAEDREILELLANIQHEQKGKLNPYVTNGLSHSYHSDESIFIWGYQE